MIAPYSETAISLSLGSVTGLRYREYNCMECGNPIVERNNDRFILYSNQVPTEAKANSDGNILTVCDRCQQNYVITVSVQVQNQTSNLPLYLQPQALFVAAEPQKKFRDLHCLECGKAFYGISDRITSIVDNVIPFDMLEPTRLGPMEIICKFNHCQQRWGVMA